MATAFDRAANVLKLSGRAAAQLRRLNEKSDVVALQYSEATILQTSMGTGEREWTLCKILLRLLQDGESMKKKHQVKRKKAVNPFIAYGKRVMARLAREKRISDASAEPVK